MSKVIIIYPLIKKAHSGLRHKDGQLLISGTTEFPGVKPWGQGFKH